MDKMTEQGRFLGTLLGRETDRFPFFDLEPDEETLERWVREGFSLKESVTVAFDLEPHYSVGLMLRSAPFFRMAPDLLHDPSAFDRHYNPDDPARYEKDFVERAAQLRQEGRVLYVDASGGGLLQMLGVGDWKSLMAACHALINEPKKVEDLLNRTTDFYCICLERVLSRVHVDYASFYEPIASSHGPVISPEMFNRYAIPGYRKVISLLDKYNVRFRVFCSTGGDLTSIISLMVDAGINVLWISNIAAASMEYMALRRHFGEHISLIGGIDAGTLGQDEIILKSKIEDTVLPLLEKGRYIPCLDDRPRADVSFSQYKLYRQILEEIARRK
ncbi:uroporphyrinogen decarboxylase family protein [Thermodesulfobacteriota bacterium]